MPLIKKKNVPPSSLTTIRNMNYIQTEEFNANIMGCPETTITGKERQGRPESSRKKKALKQNYRTLCELTGFASFFK